MEILLFIYYACSSLFLLYLVLAYFGSLISNISFEDAAAKIRAKITEYIKKSNSLSEPVPNDVFINQMLDILDNVNQLDKNFTTWNYIPNFLGFPMVYFEIVAAADTDWDFLNIRLKKTAENYIKMYGCSPMLYIYNEKNSNGCYYVCICYAVYDAAKRELFKFIKERASVYKKNVQNKVAPVIDMELEAELAQMSDETREY